ncbi:MAG TPA: (2Fe-2S)-binding protein [Candidatus Elarobacter sp.]|nr:(2Fe-2S)-binding protein [Candidatus Elarobacter sp.]
MRATAATPTVGIVVDRERVTAPAGVTVAAALLDRGVWSFRKSVSGAARGPVCGMGVCFECRVTIDDVAHQRACLVAVRDGMRIETAAGDA